MKIWKRIIATGLILLLTGPAMAIRPIGIVEYWVYVETLYNLGAEGHGYSWCIAEMYECGEFQPSVAYMNDMELLRLAYTEIFVAEYLEQVGAHGNEALKHYTCLGTQLFQTLSENESLPEEVRLEILTSDWDGGVPVTFIDSHEDYNNWNSGGYWIRDYPELARDNPWWVIETDMWAEYVCDMTDWISNPPDERWAAEAECYPCGDPEEYDYGTPEGPGDVLCFGADCGKK